MYKLLFILFLYPVAAFAQPSLSITGTWQGKLETSQKKLKYEMVITDSSGNLNGYSKIYFLVSGEEYVAIKSLKISRDKNRFIFEEDQLLFDNLQDEIPKKARQINTLVLINEGNKTELTGFFKAKVEKGQRSPTGDMTLVKLTNPDSSALLKDLTDLAIVDSKPLFPAVVAPVEPILTEIEKEEWLTQSVFFVEERSPLSRKPFQAPFKKPKPYKTTVKALPARKIKEPETVAKVAVPPASEEQQEVVVAPAPAPKPSGKPVVPVKESPKADLGNRSIETIQTVYFKSDSIKLTLYDNGEVDGDMVSIILNGRIILSKKTLSTQPISEVVYFTPDMGDSLQMIMFAENLGSIAPNTGLLIVQDGRDRYEIRFSGDLSKNAAVIFKRRKEE